VKDLNIMIIIPKISWNTSHINNIFLRLRFNRFNRIFKKLSRNRYCAHAGVASSPTTSERARVPVTNQQEDSRPKKYLEARVREYR